MTGEVFVRPDRYVVSLLPEAHNDHHLFAVHAEYRGPGVWAVTRMRDCLGADGQWDFEPSPSSREDDWLASHRFDLATALRLAREVAPTVVCNGRTAAEVAGKAR